MWLCRRPDSARWSWLVARTLLSLLFCIALHVLRGTSSSSSLWRARDDDQQKQQPRRTRSRRPANHMRHLQQPDQQPSPLATLFLTGYSVCEHLDVDVDASSSSSTFKYTAYRTRRQLDVLTVLLLHLLRNAPLGSCAAACPTLCEQQQQQSCYTAERDPDCICHASSSTLSCEDVFALLATGSSAEPATTTTTTTASPNNNGGATTTTTSPSRLSLEDDFVCTGAFRLDPGNFGGDTLYSIDYAVGTLAYDPTRRLLWIAGHAQHTRIAAFPVPDRSLWSSSSSSVSIDAVVPVSDPPVQDFWSPMEDAARSNPDGLDRITGLLVVVNDDDDDDATLVVNAETWYGTNNARDTTLRIPLDRASHTMMMTMTDATTTTTTNTSITFEQLPCQQECAGYMGRIPPALQQRFRGSAFYTGWSSVYSINARYSHGPSLWTMDLQNISGSTTATTRPYLNYPYNNGESSSWLSPRAVEYAAQGTPGPFPPADPLWNDKSAAVYAFFAPHNDDASSTLVVVGSTAGLTSGIGYKAVQSDGHVCGGPCPYDPADTYNYIWFYAVDDILAAEGTPTTPRPYYHGVWQVPYDDNGQHLIIGGTWDATEGTLYLALGEAAQVGSYDRPPLIVTFSVASRWSS